MKKNYALLFTLFLPNLTALAQIPSNNEPSNAVPITIVPYGGTPVVINGTTDSASYTTTPPNTTMPASCGCTNFATSNPNDVWYTINSNTFSNFEITIASSDYIGAPGYLRIYQDTSATGTPVLCYCGPNPDKALGTVNANNLSPNTTYFLAVSPLVGTDGFWGPFTINVFGSAVPLSVHSIFNFELNNLNSNNILNWEIDNNSEITQFKIQRKSFVTQEYETLAEIKRNLARTNYQFADANYRKEGFNTYRIVTQTIDQNMFYSDSKSINNATSKSGIAIFPNPGEDYFSISRTELDENSTIHIFDCLGRKKLSANFKKDEKEMKVDATEWPSGLYFINYQAEQNSTKTNLIWIKK